MTFQTHIPEPDSSIRGSEQFTEDQLHFLRVSRKKAVHDALNRYVAGALVGFTILTLGLLYAVHTNSADEAKQRQRDNAAATQRRADAVEARHAIVKSGRAVAVAGCNRDYRTIRKVRLVFIASKAETLNARLRGDINQRQFRRSERFYNAQLRSFPLPDCREARTIITDDPNHTTHIPTPLYPGHP